MADTQQWLSWVLETGATILVGYLTRSGQRFFSFEDDRQRKQRRAFAHLPHDLIRFVFAFFFIFSTRSAKKYFAMERSEAA